MRVVRVEPNRLHKVSVAGGDAQRLQPWLLLNKKKKKMMMKRMTTLLSIVVSEEQK